MLTEEENRLLTDVEGDAPMGRMMRQQYWIPCARSASLEADGAPARVRLLGRNYVAFRATDGRIGFFDEACPHRGVSLVLARNEDRSEEHTSELQSLMRISYAVFCLKKKKQII